MPAQDVVASPLTRKERADQDFRELFTALFAPLAHAVHRVVGDRAAAEQITGDAFLLLLTRWRRVVHSERPDAWVRRVALRRAEAAAAHAPGPASAGDADSPAIATWERLTERAYDAVLGRARRRTVRRNRALGGAAALSALVVGVLLVPDDEPGRHPLPPPPAPVAQVGPPPWVTGWGSGRGTESPLPRAALDGQWRTAPLTRADIVSALKRAGLREYAAYATTFPAEPFRVNLTVYAERSVLSVAGDQRFIAVLRVEGHRVTLEPLPPNLGFTHFRWSREGRWMSLALSGTSLVKHQGFPADVHHVALYAAAPFTRY